jgi:uncharacterized membrane protein YccC
MTRATNLRANDELFGAGARSISVRLATAMKIAGPPVRHGLRMWVSVCIALYVAFWLQLATPYFAGLTAIIVCLLPGIGASLRRSWFRLVGALIGSVAIVVLTSFFPQDRISFLFGLALWGASCAFAGTVLKNFTGYAALLSGIAAALIANVELGTTGGAGGKVFLIAINFVALVSVGIFSAGIVFGLTDSLGAPRRLAARLGEIADEIVDSFLLTLVSAGREQRDAQQPRPEFFGHVAALDPMIEESLGESSMVRHHAPVLEAAADGCFMAFAGSHALKNRLAQMSDKEAKQQAAIILRTLPRDLTHGQTDRWLTDPAVLYRVCEAAIHALVALPATSPSLRLLADDAADALAGLSHVFNGLALLVAEPVRPTTRRRGITGLRVPDWLPALANAGRAFAAIAAVMLFWIMSAWPHGALAVAFTTVVVLLVAPMADISYAAAKGFAVGYFLAAIFAAIVGFMVLPAFPTQSFGVLCMAMGIALVPSGALLMQKRRAAIFTALSILYVVVLAPSNPMSYNPAQFYNAAAAIVAGSTVAALSFVLFPSPSAALRIRRLLALSLRDLRRLAKGRTPTHWQSHIFSRLAAIPHQATPLERTQLLAVLSVGVAIIQLRKIADVLGLGAGLTPALMAVAQGNSAAATLHLRTFDTTLAAQPQTQTLLRARGRLIGISEALARHAAYFDAVP